MFLYCASEIVSMLTASETINCMANWANLLIPAADSSIQQLRPIFLLSMNSTGGEFLHSTPLSILQIGITVAIILLIQVIFQADMSICWFQLFIWKVFLRFFVS